MSHGAGCLCGQVRIRIDAEPVMARACWCRLCRYLAAGNAMRRGFCPECGTPAFSQSS